MKIWLDFSESKTQFFVAGGLELGGLQGPSNLSHSAILLNTQDSIIHYILPLTRNIIL